MNAKREADRDLSDLLIGGPDDPARRDACELDVFLFLKTYLAAKFTKPFTADQREMVNDILRSWRYGEDQAIAAARGDGKTSIAEGLAIYCICYGKIKFLVLIGANGPSASQVLENIKLEFEDNDLLAADFKEICIPIRALDGANQKARKQKVNGKRTRIQWAKETAVFPTVEGSRASGSIITARGADAAIRGVRFGNQRPDAILIDDAETRESADSPAQTAKREKIIEQDVGGLAGPGRRLGRAFLCTVFNRTCLAYKFTDRTQKPSWNGRRYKLLPQKPDREDLWETYVLERQTKGREAATAFYVANREAMDAGAVVSNPNRVEPGQLSPLQHCYDIIADRGAEAFATEYQNDPPDDRADEEGGITAPMIQTKVNGIPRGIVPADVTAMGAGFDIGDRACHWAVVGGVPGARGYVIDYGVAEVYNTVQMDDAGVEGAIRRTLHQWREELLADPYRDDAGNEHPIKYALIDSGYRTDAVYGFIRDVGGPPFRAAKGFGSAKNQTPFRLRKPDGDPTKAEHWYAEQMQPSGVYLHGLDSDYWKRWLHDRLLTPTTSHSSFTLFGLPEEARQHLSFAKHLTAEIQTPDFVSGRGARTVWKRVSANNHWFDAMYMACAALAMAGISLMPSERNRVVVPVKQPKPVPVGSVPRKGWTQSWRGRF